MNGIDHAFRDIATNPTLPRSNVPVLEYPDVVLPTLLDININYMTGLLVFTFDETIDATPAALTVLLSGIAMIDWRGTNSFALDTYNGADIVEVDGVTLKARL